MNDNESEDSEKLLQLEVQGKEEFVKKNQDKNALKCTKNSLVLKNLCFLHTSSSLKGLSASQLPIQNKHLQVLFYILLHL